MLIKSDNLVPNPLVSIIIPSYNRESTITTTIDSILNQRCNFDFELIIGDDGSTDHSREILKNYQQKHSHNITLIFQDINLGLGANWATCAKLCRGKYIATCDDDDYWHNTEKLSLQVAIMEENKKIGLIHTNYRTLNGKTGKLKEQFISNDGSQPLLQSLFSGKYFFVISSVMLRKDLMDKFINLNDYIKYRFPIQDWNTCILLAKHTEFYHLDLSTVTYRIGSSSISRPTEYNSVINKYAKEKQMYKYLCDQLPNDLHFNENGYDHYVLSILLNLAYKRFDFKKAKEYAKLLMQQGSNSLKVKCTMNPISFYLFIFLKRIKSKTL